MDDVTSMLSEAELDLLRAKYDGREVSRMLAASLPRDYAPSRAYVDAIIEIFFSGREPDDRTERDALSVPDRERCIIGILAAQRQRYTLAVHVYLGLMERIRPAEIANVLLLAGVYSGVDSFAHGIIVAKETMTLLRGFARSRESDAREPATILKALRTKFAETPDLV